MLLYQFTIQIVNCFHVLIFLMENCHRAELSIVWLVFLVITFSFLVTTCECCLKKHNCATSKSICRLTYDTNTFISKKRRMMRKKKEEGGEARKKRTKKKQKQGQDKNPKPIKTEAGAEGQNQKYIHFLMSKLKQVGGNPPAPTKHKQKPKRSDGSLNGNWARAKIRTTSLASQSWYWRLLGFSGSGHSY